VALPVTRSLVLRPSRSDLAVAVVHELSRPRKDISHDWSSYVHHRPVLRGRNHLLGSASNCGQLRWKLEHGRRHDPGPLRNNRDWPRHRSRPHFFYRRVFRFLPDQVGWPRFSLGAGSDECRGRPAHRPWYRPVWPSSGQRHVGWPRALRSLFGRLERYALLMRRF